MSHLRTVGVLAVGMAAILVDPDPARAFCIENQADEVVTFEIDVDGRGNNAPFVATLAPEEETCCDWQRYDCNMSGREDGILKFSVGTDAWVCSGEFSANDDVYFRARAGRSYCSFWARNSLFGGEYWHSFTDWLEDMIARFRASLQSS